MTKWLEFISRLKTRFQVHKGSGIQKERTQENIINSMDYLTLTKERLCCVAILIPSEVDFMEKLS